MTTQEECELIRAKVSESRQTREADPELDLQRYVGHKIWLAYRKVQEQGEE